MVMFKVTKKEAFELLKKGKVIIAKSKVGINKYRCTTNKSIRFFTSSGLWDLYSEVEPWGIILT